MVDQVNTSTSGRVIAWASFVLGIAVSIAGNIGHAASDGMLPGEWAGATFWPLALMLSIEILTRVRWQRGKPWMLARGTSLVVVAAVAAVLSYRHLAGLMTYWGEDKLNAHLGPLAVDGLMLMAATALLSISKEVQPVAELETSPPAVVEEEGRTPQIKGETASMMILDDPLPPPKSSEPSGLHVVQNVSSGDAEEAALQAWIQSNKTMSSSQVAAIGQMSKSTAARRIQTWKQHEGRRIERR